MTPSILTKHCRKCGEIDRDMNSGRCLPCTRIKKAIHYIYNAEHIKATSAARYLSNPGKASIDMAAYRAANRNKLKGRAVLYHLNNREKINARSSAYRIDNLVKAAAYHVEWSANNPEIRRIHAQNRRARSSGGKLSKDLAATLFAKQNGLCYCCKQPLGDKTPHLDHWMPLALGGSNTDDNMRLLHQRCNNQKHAKHPVDFMQSLGHLF